MIHAGDEEKTSVLLCALRCVAACGGACRSLVAAVVLTAHAARAGSTDTTHLDLILDEYAEFTLEGDTPVHLCGAWRPSKGGPHSVLFFTTRNSPPHLCLRQLHA